jgi:hypothetical protein
MFQYSFVLAHYLGFDHRPPTAALKVGRPNKLLPANLVSCVGPTNFNFIKVRSNCDIKV